MEPELVEYLRGERESIRQQIKMLFGRAARIDALLRRSPAGIIEQNWKVEVLPTDPFKSISIWPMTATTTMGRCREALQTFGREATAQEVKALIAHQFGASPAKSIVEMLRKRSSDERSGIYRIAIDKGPAKYGLTIWKKTGIKHSDGSYSPAEKDEPIPTNDE